MIIDKTGSPLTKADDFLAAVSVVLVPEAFLQVESQTQALPVTASQTVLLAQITQLLLSQGLAVHTSDTD
jgi:hypothetical protein